MAAWDLETQYVDDALGMHVMRLRNSQTGATHLLQVVLKADSCPLCGHATPKDNLGELNPQKHLIEELTSLNQSHEAIQGYKLQHGLKSKK